MPEKRNLKSCLIKETSGNFGKVWKVIKDAYKGFVDCDWSAMIFAICFTFLMIGIPFIASIFKFDIVSLLILYYICYPSIGGIGYGVVENKLSVKFFYNVFIWWNKFIVYGIAVLLILSLNIDIALLISIALGYLIYDSFGGLLSTFLAFCVFVCLSMFNIALFKCLRLWTVLDWFDFSFKE